MNWLEVSLTLDPELAEPVADVLARHVPHGVAIESTAIASDRDGEGHPIGPVRVRAFLPAEDPPTLAALRQRLEQDLFHLGMIRPLPPPTFAQVADSDWGELWKANYHPVRVGRRLVVVPSWLQDWYTGGPDHRPDDVLVVLDPGMAFGTGSHPTTQMCLALVEDFCRPSDQVLDLGCGSGILSIAAAKLGASSVVAADIDPEAIRATRDNARENRVADKIDAVLGSLPELRGQSPSPAFHLVVANILSGPIIQLLKTGLAQTLRPEGTLVVSGTLSEQAEDVRAALGRAGLTAIDQRHSGDWVAFAARRT